MHSEIFEQALIISFIVVLCCTSYVENTVTNGYFDVEEKSSTKDIEDIALDYENDKNSVIAVTEREKNIYDDFYDELDNRVRIEQSMNMIFFGPPSSFMRIDAETILHLFTHTMKHLIPISRVLTAWDILTDGKTAAFLQGREFMALGKLLNFVPEEDLYYINFGDLSVMKYFANNHISLLRRKYGILAAAFRRYYGGEWYLNSTVINDLGYLLCGFTSNELSQITPVVFKQLSTEVLGKISKCNYNQTRTLYNIAVHPEAYGEPYRWSSHEVSRLGVLFTCIPKKDINSIPLEALSAITVKVMKYMNQNKLDFFTKQQILRLTPEARRIYILRMQLKSSLDMSQIAKQSGCERNHVFVPGLFVNMITLLLYVINYLSIYNPSLIC